LKTFSQFPKFSVTAAEGKVFLEMPQLQPPHKKTKFSDISRSRRRELRHFFDSAADEKKLRMFQPPPPIRSSAYTSSYR
jgi:hypothetical protein